MIRPGANGAPRTPLATTSQLTFHSTDPAGWYHLAFATPLHLSAGRYWLGVLTGATTHVAGWRTDMIAGSRRIDWNPFSSGPSDPFGPATIDDEQMSLYASYIPEIPASSIRPHQTRAAYQRPLRTPSTREHAPG